MNKFFYKLMTAAALQVSLPAHARFLHTDAAEIDQDETYNSESYNDAKAYEFPAYWDDLWQTYDLGYRITFGSLNQNKFLVDEHIKLVSPSEYPIAFSFEHQRYEDLLERRLTEEIRLFGGMRQGVYAAIAAEGGHFKKYGDMGGAVGWREGPRKFIELAYMEVDLFYNVKQDRPGSSYTKKPWSLALKGKWVEGAQEWIEFMVEHDAPLTHTDKPQDIGYQYARNIMNVSWTTTLANFGLWRGKLRLESKSESRDWMGLGFYKKMTRLVGVLDQSLEFEWLDVPLRPGIMLIGRNVDYIYRGTISDPEKKPREGDAPGVFLRSPDSIRKEYMPYIVTRQVISEPSHVFQYGLYAAHAMIAEAGDPVYSNEIKFQCAYEFRFSDRAYVMINTAWDVDNMTSDFPYEDGRFRPWDGGNVQFYAVF